MNNIFINSCLPAIRTYFVLSILAWGGLQTIGATGTKSTPTHSLLETTDHSPSSLFAAFGFRTPLYEAPVAPSSYGTANNSFMAGVLISYANSTGGPLVKQDVTACDGMSLTQARFIVTNDVADNMTIALDLPPGVFYEAGSVSVVATSAGLTVAEGDIADLNAPTFTISPADLDAGNSITLQWDRRNGMTCDAYDLATAGGTFKDNISVSTDLGITADVDPMLNSYNLLFPSLSLAGADPITTIVGSTVTRTVTVTNGGLGFLGGYSFTIDNGTGTNTTSLTTEDGTVLTPTSTLGTVSTYTITPAIIAEYGDMDAMFDNSEQMVFTRAYEVLSCDNASAYQAFWGCPDACMLATTLPQQTNIANGVPNVGISWSTQTSQGTCVDGEYTATFTNNGSGGVAGTAFDLDFLFATDRYSDAPYGYVGFRPLSNFSINGTALTVSQTGSGPYIVDEINFGTDLDGVSSGLEDIDGDGQFDDLAVGASVTITFSATYNCGLVCDVRRFSTLDAVVDYEDQCETEAENNRGAAGLTNHGSPLGTNSGPPDIADGVPFTIEVCTEHQYGGFSCPTNEMIMTFTLPTGMTANSGSRNGNPASLTTNGNEVSFVLGYNRVNCWELELVYDCSIGNVNGPISIPYELTYTCDVNCCTEEWVCGEFITNSHCPGTEPCPGVFNSGTTLDRTNFGWTSQDLSTPVDPTTLPRNNRKRALPCDTLLFTAEGFQGGSHDNLSLSYEFGTIAGNLPALNFLDGTGNIEITDASTGTIYDCPAPLPAMSVASGITTNLWDFSSLIGTCLPAGFVFEAGDTYSFTANYVVTDNAGTTATGTQIPNTLAYFYNLDTDGITELSCDDYRTEMYLLRVNTSNNYADKFNNGCTQYTGGGTFRLGSSPLGTDYFENEFRPWARIDAFEVTINTGDVYDASVTPTMRANGGIGTGGNVTISLPAPTITDNVLRWENDGTWPFADISAAPYEEYYFTYGLITSCASTSGTLTNQVEYTDNFYLGEDSDCADPLVYTRNQQVTLSGRPNLVTSDLTGEVQANSVEESWDLQLFNNTTLDAPYPWFALEDNPDVTILQVIDLSDNSVLTPIPYADGNWYQLGGVSGDAIIGAEEAEYRIFYSTTSCDLQDIDVISGWDCPSYPTDPTAYVCQTGMVTLSTIGLSSEVQIQLTQEPTPPFMLCNSLDYEVLLNSAQSADLDNPVLAVVNPTGLTLDGTISIFYPNDATGTTETVSFTTSGDTIFIDLESHPGIGADGMQGTVNALSTGEREALVMFSLLTDCAFSSGANVEIIGYGERPCGGPADNNGVRVVSEDLFIQGAERQYLADINFGAGLSPLVNCALLTADIDMTLIGLLSDMTSALDTLLITLDSGLEYEPGSFTNAAGLTLISSTGNASGETVLKISMPSAPIDLSGGAVDIMMNFMFNAAEESGCDVTKQITAELSNTITGLACASELSGVCDDTKVILGDAETDIFLLKTNATLSANTTACSISTDMIAISGSLEVTSQDLPADGSIVVEFFCADGSGMPTGLSIGSYTLTGPVIAGTTVPFETELSNNCLPLNGIVAQISNEQNCICSSSMALLEVGELVSAEAGNSQTICSTNSVELASLGANVTPTTPTIGATWTSSGNGTFDDGAGVFGVATSYTPGPLDRSNGEVTLTLTTDDPADAPVNNTSCRIASDEVTIFILKVDCGAFLWDGND